MCRLLSLLKVWSKAQMLNSGKGRLVQAAGSSLVRAGCHEEVLALGIDVHFCRE